MRLRAQFDRIVKFKILIFVLILASLAPVYLDREWIFGRIRPLAAPALVLLFIGFLAVFWFLGVLVTRLLNLPDAGPVYILGLGSATVTTLVSGLVLMRLLRGRG